MLCFLGSLFLSLKNSSCLILMLEIYDVSDFELKMLQPVSYWGKNLDTRQIFTIEFHTVSDFAENFAKNSRHVFFYFVERTEFGVFVL